MPHIPEPLKNRSSYYNNHIIPKENGQQVEHHQWYKYIPGTDRKLNVHDNDEYKRLVTYFRSCFCPIFGQ